MASIEFLTVEYNPNAARKLEAFIQQFEQARRHTVIPSYHSWESVWHALVNVGIYRRGADMAEVGTTWLDSLISMNALRPFSERDLAILGGAPAFLPTAWEHATVHGRKEVWAIPYRMDVRVMHYWRDWMEQAKVEPQNAFSSPAAFKKTLAALQKIVPHPYAGTSNRGDQNTVYEAASWVWAMGGDFVSPDGKSVLFDKPAALEGLCQYFDLYRFMKPGLMTNGEVQRAFVQRESAAMSLGPWMRPGLEVQNRGHLIPNMGIALPPGPAFMGGTALVVWQHTRVEREVVDFIDHLTSPQVQSVLVPLSGMLPVLKEAWDEPVMKEDSWTEVFYEALKTGRVLSRVSVWGIIEEKLKIEFSMIWEEIFSAPNPDIEAIVRKRLLPLARRLNITLGL